MTTPIPSPHPVPHWQNWSIDKVGLTVAWDHIVPEVAKMYAKGPITVLQWAKAGVINFHAESLVPGAPLTSQIAYHLIGLARAGLFSRGFAEDLETNLTPIPPFGGPVLPTSLRWLTAAFRIHQVEFAFDFPGVVPWRITNANLLGGFLTTIYSPDHRGLPPRQRSLVAIYDHAACHGYPGPMTRLELRFCDRYSHRWDLGKLNFLPLIILARFGNMMAGCLKVALPTAAVKFDLALISATHPQLAAILERWATWGLPKPVQPTLVVGSQSELKTVPKPPVA